MYKFRKIIRKINCLVILISFFTLQLIPSALSPLADTLSDENNSTSTNNSTLESSTKTDTTTSLTQNLGIIYYGDSILFIAKVNNYNATGTVTFIEGDTELGTTEISDGTAYFRFDALSIGTHSITATYNGDNTFNGSTSNPLSVTVNRGYGKISLSSSLESNIRITIPTYDYGDLIAFKCTLSPTIATGKITFKEGDDILGEATLLNDNGSLTATIYHGALSVGTHNIYAEYSGDANMNKAVSQVLTITINKATPNINLTSSESSPPYGTNVIYTADLNNVRATGTVTFMDGESEIYSVPVQGGKAIANCNYLSIGDHVITAVYSGDANCNPSTSNDLPTTVTKGYGELTLSNSIKTDDYGNELPFIYGDRISFVSRLRPKLATGTATFKDGSTILATVDYSPSRISLIASYTTYTLGAGEHHITVEYSGDSKFLASTTDEILITIQKANTTTSITNSTNSCATGDVVTYTANINNETATGTVTFIDGDKVLGTSEVASGVATFSTNDLSAGDHSITAIYNGDSNLNGSTSTPSLITVTSNTVDSTTTLQSSNDNTFYSDSVTFTATVNNANVTGTITFKDGDTDLAIVPIINGSAAYTTNSLSIGDHNISANYSGNLKFNPSISNTVTQKVNKKDTNTTITSSANPCVYGVVVTFKITVNESAATGKITLMDGDLVLASDLPLINIDGVPTVIYTTTSLSAGNHDISAIYSGDSKFNPSTSNPITQTINKKNTNTVITSSLNPCVYGAEVTFIVAVDSNTATGTITLMDGSSILASNLSFSNIDGIPIATYKTNNLSIGSHYISASYSGDSNHNNSNSNTLTQVITKKPSIVSSININGPTSIIISTTENTDISYSVDVLDQYKNILFNEGVTWSLSKPIDGVAISPDGILTVTNTATPTSFMVIAKSITDSSVVGYQLVSLTKNLIPVESVFLNKPVLPIKAGSNNSLTALAFPVNAYCESITWQSSDPTIVTVDDNGNLHAIRAGKTTVTVNITSNGITKSAECTVLVLK